MVNRWWARTLVLGLVALVSLGAGARWAASQASFQEGSFVTAQDGSRWVVGNGQKHRVQFTSDDGNALAGLPEGRSVSTVSEAVEVLLGGSAPPASGSAAPAPANPAETLIGQRAVVCNYGVPLELAVARVEWVKTLLGTDAPGNAMWVVTYLDVTNQGTTDESLYSTASLTDERNRSFIWRAYPPDPVDFGRAYGVKGSYENYAPGITEQTVAAFQVPGDVRSLTLVGGTTGTQSCG